MLLALAAVALCCRMIAGLRYLLCIARMARVWSSSFGLGLFPGAFQSNSSASAFDRRCRCAARLEQQQLLVVHSVAVRSRQCEPQQWQCQRQQ